MKTKPNSARGFTLVEIMVVVLLLALLAGVLVPNLAGSVETARLDTGAHQMADLLDYCYNAASASGRVHGLIFNGDRRRFQVVAENLPDPSASASLTDGPQLESVRIPGLLNSTLPEGITLSSVSLFEQDLAQGEEDQIRILFFPDGTTEFANLYLSDTAGNRRLVELNGFSGTISVSRLGPESEEKQK